MTAPEIAGTPASIRVRRRVEWMDTDAAGFWHYTAAFRLAEAAEAALMTELGIAKRTFGLTPRVRVDFEYRRTLYFNDLVDIDIAVERVGRCSVRFAIAISDAEGACVEGTITACYIAGGASAPWPQDIRDKLASGGVLQESPEGLMTR